ALPGSGRSPGGSRAWQFPVKTVRRGRHLLSSCEPRGARYGRQAMQFSHVRFPSPADGDRIVEVLSEEQFLKPQQSVADAMAAVVERLGVCPGAAQEAVRSLGVELGMSVGRLRRTELM